MTKGFGVVLVVWVLTLWLAYRYRGWILISLAAIMTAWGVLNLVVMIGWR